MRRFHRPHDSRSGLNHIEAFLHTIGRTALHGRFVLADNHGRPRLLVPSKVWEDYLRVGVTEIRE